MKKRICSLVLVFTLIFTSLVFTEPQRADAATISYTFVFKPNGGTGSMSNFKTQYNVMAALPKNKFVKNGYIFNGWIPYRKSDKSWYCTDGKNYKWFPEKKIPSTYHKQRISDGWDGKFVRRASTVNGDVITMYAQWKLNPTAKVAEKAKSQIGKRGSTYWKWYGFEGDWCAMFASWCINKCGLGKVAGGKQAGVITWTRWLKNNGKYKVRGSYIPKAGDLIFLETNNNKSDGVDHVGIVEKVQNGRVYTIEGNTNSSNFYKSVVARHSYSLKNTNIYGYGVYA